MVRNLAKLEVDFSKSDRNIFRKSQQVFLLGNRKYKHRPQLPVAGKLKELKLEKGHFQNTVTEVPEHPTLPFSSLLKNCRVLKRKNFVFYTIISNSVYVLISAMFVFVCFMCNMVFSTSRLYCKFVILNWFKEIQYLYK